MSLPVACVRLLRSSTLLTMRSDAVTLRDNWALRRHVELTDPSDHFFYVSHRHYLVRGLTRRQRTQAALHHYAHEMEAFDEGYRARVYGGEGLRLWSCRVRDHAYELRLEPGHDVLYEGGLTVTLRIDGGRVAVMSFATVHPSSIGCTGDDPVLFVARNQRASDHAYQSSFHAAFDRCTPAHFCLAGVAAIAKAQGIRAVYGARATSQVSFRPDRAATFEKAYGEFWYSAGGKVSGPSTVKIPVPLRLTPLELMSTKSRRRAVRRRRHLDEIDDGARAQLSAHVR